MKGNEQDCICEKPKGKHRKNCDAYRLSQVMIKVASLSADQLSDSQSPDHDMSVGELDKITK